jgi:hypothetical protein
MNFMEFLTIFSKGRHLKIGIFSLHLFEKIGFLPKKKRIVSQFFFLKYSGIRVFEYSRILNSRILFWNIQIFSKKTNTLPEIFEYEVFELRILAITEYSNKCSNTFLKYLFQLCFRMTLKTLERSERFQRVFENSKRKFKKVSDDFQKF